MIWLLYITIINPAGHASEIAPMRFNTHKLCEDSKPVMVGPTMPGWVVVAKCEGAKK